MKTCKECEGTGGHTGLIIDTPIEYTDIHYEQGKMVITKPLKTHTGWIDCRWCKGTGEIDDRFDITYTIPLRPETIEK